MKKNIPERLGTFLFFTVLSGVFLTCLLGRIDPDYFWRLKHGEMIVKDGLFPMKETFSFTAPGARMAVNAWLSEVIFYEIHSSFGYLGQALIQCALLTLIHWLLYLFLTRNILIPPFGSAALTGLCAVLFFNVAAPRVQIFTFLFFTLSLFAVVEWEKGNEKAPYWIALLIFPWVNLHSGFMIALVLLALIALGKIVEDRRLTLRAMSPLALGLLLSLINPEGYQVFAFPISSLTNTTILNTIQEVRPLDILDPSRFYPYLSVLFLLMIAGVRKISSRRFPWVLLCFMLIYQSMTFLRMTPFFAIVGVLCAGFSLKNSEDPRKLRILFIGIALFSGAMTARYCRLYLKNVYPWDESHIHHGFPLESVQLIRKKYPGKNIFNDFNWGGYLIYHLPENRVAVDSRTMPYLDFMKNGYWPATLAFPQTSWILDQIQADLVLCPAKSYLAGYMSRQANWERVVNNATESLFVRK